MDLWKIADKVIGTAYPGKPGWWGEQRIPNYGILRGAIVQALVKCSISKRQPKKVIKHKQLPLRSQHESSSKTH